MENKNQKSYLILSILLLAAIIVIVGFVIVPRYLPKTPEQILEKIDFSGSAWNTRWPRPHMRLEIRLKAESEGELCQTSRPSPDATSATQMERS